jgi:S-DNA-T family DNA segregation ATPase FtsK/SpoIIIE
MERRYACLDALGVRDIRSYNKRIKERGLGVEHLPYIIAVIDEYADIISVVGKEFESAVARLTATGCAAGMHLILTTRHSSIDVITGLIKAHISGRIAFAAANKLESRIIIDAPGAEKLLGKGDMLYAEGGDNFPLRIQAPYVSAEEVKRIVEYAKSQGPPDYIDDDFF